MKLRAPYTTERYHPAHDAVWVLRDNTIVALLSPEAALRFYGETDAVPEPPVASDLEIDIEGLFA